jgi:hypothetical protein
MTQGKCGAAALFNVALAKRSGGSLVYGDVLANIMNRLKAYYGLRGALLLVDGVSPLFLVNGTSNLCLSGGC